MWVALAPYWARKSDHHGRKPLILLGLAGFIVSMTLCGFVLAAGLNGLVGGAATFGLFAIFRAIYGSLGCATPSATQAYLASRTRRSARVNALSALASSFGLGTIIGPAMAPLFVLPFIGLPGPLFGFAVIGILVFTAIALWLPDDTKGRHVGRGAAMSYPSSASPVTGASVIAATAPRTGKLKMARSAHPALAPRRGHRRPCPGRDPHLRRFLRHRPPEDRARRLGTADRDRHDRRRRSRPRRAMGPDPPARPRPARIDPVGRRHAAAGNLAMMLAANLYGLVIGFALSSLGFGFTRPGFTAGASLAVPLNEQGGVAGVITAANGIAFVAAPAIGMALYAIDDHLPFAVAAALCRRWPPGPATPRLGSSLLGTVRGGRGRSMPGETKPMPPTGRTASLFSVRSISA